MATLNVGRVRLLNKGEYSVSAAYDFFDWVTYEGSSYVVTASSGAPAGTLPTDTSYWSLLADKGDKGDTGLAASVSVGSVSTGAPDSPASVTNSGTENDAVFNFVIPKGDTGSPGPMGGVYSRGLGEMVFSLLPITDAGLHLLDGSLLQVGGIYDTFITYVAALQTDYPGLFVTESEWQESVESYGVCGKFVYTEGVSLRIPKITGFVEGTLDSTALGDLVEAGLPNITGSFRITDNVMTNANVSKVGRASGVCTVGTVTSTTAVATAANIVTKSGNDVVNISAQNANPIYGNSTTVQPQAIKGYLYMVVATSAKTDIEVNIDNIATDLNGKADKTEVANLAMPSDSYVSLSFSGEATYTAPADGYFQLFTREDGTCCIQLLNNTNRVECITSTTGSNWGASGYVPAHKGDKVFVNAYNATAASIPAGTLRFIYAEGSQP